MQLVWAERTYPITGGFVLSVLFHLLLAVVAVILVPLFVVPTDTTPPGIQATIISDMNAAPKVDKLGKPDDKPKPPQPPAPEQKKPEPPKPAAPVTPAPATPPPAAAPEKAVDIPDETKKADLPKKDEPKPDEKKADKKPDDKAKPKKDDQQVAMDALLNNLAKQQPAPDTKDKTKPKAQAAPAEPTVGQQAALVNDVPLTISESDDIAQQIEPQWNVDTGALPDPKAYIAWLRVTFGPDGSVLTVDFLEPERLSDPRYRQVAESCMRAFKITQHINFPPGKVQSAIRFGCDPSLMQ
jgi:hypothetical protein